ncbi:hypothetical protein G6F37_007186 [Rhizopus arrhizus]|nr:hypothetical protein G6F38_005743 [Rhizopus arrhizus]KAG1156899.1 hypothetical protein G6F37_007186 [Rhizopus arrhizus]
MYNNSNHNWTFHRNSESNNSEFNEPLQEPVAFEDFQFSLGLDPNFAMPIQLDIPPTSMDPFSYIPPPETFSSQNTSVLNEQDQKAFSEFLDQLYVNPNMQIDPQPFSLYSFEEEQEEQVRQSTILHSLDEQKKSFKEKPNAVYLQQSNAISAPYIIRENNKEKQKTSTSSSSASSNSSSSSSSNNNSNHIKSGSGGGGGGGAMRRGKSNKELLTEEEKRSNHIASEQKRRGMIRSGFKDLTEIVPTLKNINNSKSTVLFKAVDYIKYLEKRNRNLREKIKNLEVRAEVEGRMGVLGRTPHHHHPSSSTQAALLQHKTQQRQLYELQEKLQHHQKLIAQQKLYSPSSNSLWHNEKTKNEYEDTVSA